MGLPEYDVLMAKFWAIPVEDKDTRFNELMNIARALAAHTGTRQFVFYNKLFDSWEIRSIRRSSREIRDANRA